MQVQKIVLLLNMKNIFRSEHKMASLSVFTLLNSALLYHHVVYLY